MGKRKESTAAEMKADTPEKRHRWVDNMRYGRALSADFFRHNAWVLLLIVVTVISLIGLRYKTKTKMQQIKRLQVELEHAKSDKLREKAEYMTLIRESEMLRLVNEKGLGLEFREQPPYEIEITE